MLQSIFRSDFEAHLATAVARLSALNRPDLIAKDLAPIMLYANNVRADLTIARLERLLGTALPDLGGDVMNTLFEKQIQEGRLVGLQEGRQEGLQDAIMLGLELKFGAEGLALLPKIRPIHDLITLRAIREALPRIQTIDELQAWLGRSS